MNMFDVSTIYNGIIKKYQEINFMKAVHDIHSGNYKILLVKNFTSK